MRKVFTRSNICKSANYLYIIYKETDSQQQIHKSQKYFLPTIKIILAVIDP